MVQILREEHPRLYHPADDPDYRFDLPEDAARKQILKNFLFSAALETDSRTAAQPASVPPVIPDVLYGDARNCADRALCVRLAADGRSALVETGERLVACGVEMGA